MRREVHPCGPGGRSRGHRLPAPLAPKTPPIRLAWRDKRTSKTRKGCTRVWCDIFTSAHFFVSLNLYFRERRHIVSTTTTITPNTITITIAKLLNDLLKCKFHIHVLIEDC